MKFICSKSNLLNGVQIVSKAVPNKTTMSILECILIDTTKGNITLTANDMELGIETVIDGEIIEKGNHSELMKLSGTYKGMVEEYDKAVSWKIGRKESTNA